MDLVVLGLQAVDFLVVVLDGYGLERVVDAFELFLELDEFGPPCADVLLHFLYGLLLVLDALLECADLVLGLVQLLAPHALSLEELVGHYLILVDFFLDLDAFELVLNGNQLDGVGVGLDCEQASAVGCSGVEVGRWPRGYLGSVLVALKVGLLLFAAAGKRTGFVGSCRCEHHRDNIIIKKGG